VLYEEEERDAQLTMPLPRVFSVQPTGSRQTRCRTGPSDQLRSFDHSDAESRERKRRTTGSSTLIGKPSSAIAAQPFRLKIRTCARARLVSSRPKVASSSSRKSERERTLPSHPPTASHSPSGAHLTHRIPSPTNGAVERSCRARSCALSSGAGGGAGAEDLRSGAREEVEEVGAGGERAA